MEKQLISPNMANITKNLQLNLKQLYEDTNTHKTKVELKADQESYLDIKEDSKFVNSLVDYSAYGGGNIFMRVAGKRKLLQQHNPLKNLIFINIYWMVM